MTADWRGIRACVFDAYGTLFDVHAPAAQLRDRLGERADALSAVWRTKQLEYTWLRSLMRSHTDFWQVTGEALDFALEDTGLAGEIDREALLQQYMTLDAYPDAAPALDRLRAGGLKTAILSNGEPKMLAAATGSAGLDSRLDAVLSVEEARIFKPDPATYQIAVDRLDVAAGDICFVSTNAWDAAGAASFGMRVTWLNRFGRTSERLPAQPHAEITELDALPVLLGQ